MYEGGTIRDECRVREEGMVLCTRGALSRMSAGRGKRVWYYVRGGTIRDECRVREEGMVLCTRGALSGMSAG